MIVQELTNNDINVTLITETWTKDTQEDLAWLNQSELLQGHYEISTHNIKLLENGNTPTLEYVIWIVICDWNLPSTTKGETQHNKWDGHR